MRLADAVRITLNGRQAVRATLNGQVVWSAEEPVPGTVYTEDFSGYAVGDTTVAGFTSRWATLTRQIVEVQGEKALRLAASRSSTRCMLTYDAIDTDVHREDFSIFAQFLTSPDSAIFSPCRMAGRVAGPSGAETAIAAGTALGSSIRIDQYTGGSFSTLNSANFTHASIRMNLIMTVKGDQATLKTWVDGGTEPESPQVTGTVSVADAGGVGILIFGNTPIDLVFFSVATGDRNPERKPVLTPLEGFSTDAEVAALTSASFTNDAMTSISPPTNLNYSGSSGAWGYYFAVVEDATGSARELEIQNASNIGGNISDRVHLANWSADPHSDEWTPLAYSSTIGGAIRFSQPLPDALNKIALCRTPGYTVTRIYDKTAEYRQSQYVSDPPSAIEGNYGFQVSPNDWRGEPVPDLPMPAYKISDGQPGSKNIIVLTAGNHAYECHADYNLEGSVEFLLSEDPIAQNLRQWCDIFVYPTINPAGRWAGYSRANPELKAAGLHDHNRIWGSTNRDTTVKLKAAFQDDFNQSPHVLIDYHTFAFSDDPIDRGIWAPNGGQNPEFMSRYAVREPANVNNRLVGSTTSVSTLPEFALQTMGALVAVHSEESPSILRNVPEYRESGRALMLALWDMIDDGLLPHGPG